MPASIFLKITEVPGESMVDGFTGQIEIDSFSHGVAQSVAANVSNQERTTGVPTIADIMCTKEADKSTAALIEACLKASVFPEGILTACRNDAGATIPLITYTLTNVIIASHSIGGSANNKPAESFALNFTACNWMYESQKQTGGKEGQVKASWDSAKNKAAAAGK